MHQGTFAHIGKEATRRLDEVLVIEIPSGG